MEDDHVDLCSNRNSDLISRLQDIRWLVNTNTDLIRVVCLLKKNEAIKQALYVRLLNEFSSSSGSRSERQTYVSMLLKSVPLKQLIEVFLTLQGNLEANIEPEQIPNSDLTFKFYYMMKRYVDNNNFEDKCGTLFKMVNKLKTEMLGCHKSDERQKFADKLVPVYTVLLISQPRTREEREGLLTEMKEAIPRDIDTNTVDIVYHSKMAITAEASGDVELAEEHIKQAKIISSRCKRSFATALVNHDSQLIYVMKYEKHVVPEHLGCVIDEGDLALRCLMDISAENVRNQWSRISVLYKVLSMLGIRHDFSFIETHKADVKQQKDAKDLLNKMQHISQNIETRRDMISSLCWGRLYETTDVLKAFTYVKRALTMAKEGSTYCKTEQENISKYLSHLESQLKEANNHLAMEPAQ